MYRTNTCGELNISNVGQEVTLCGWLQRSRDLGGMAQFGFLMDAFTYGAPPHAGLAFGFDRLCSLFGGADSIRDFIAFPKNNSGRDVMSGSPSLISDAQLDELQIKVDLKG